MYGHWAVQIEDGTHTIHADIIVGIEIISSLMYAGRVKVTWDGVPIDTSPVRWLIGDIKSFELNGHSFLLRVRGPGILGRLVLYMDGVEVPTSVGSGWTWAELRESGRNLINNITAGMNKAGMTPPVRSAPPLGRASRRARPRPPHRATIQFIKELSVQDSEEIVGTEQYPLDNRFGDQAFTTVRQVSRESTNELSIDTGSQLGGKIGLNVLSVIKAETEAQVSQKTGHKIGEKVTESQTLTFSVGPKSLVLYEVVWKRKVRSGELLYLSSGSSVTVPYRINYGLMCEVRTQALAGGH